VVSVFLAWQSTYWPICGQEGGRDLNIDPEERTSVPVVPWSWLAIAIMLALSLLTLVVLVAALHQSPALHDATHHALEAVGKVAILLLQIACLLALLALALVITLLFASIIACAFITSETVPAELQHVDNISDLDLTG
jgi:hypothetical protein